MDNNIAVHMENVSKSFAHKVANKNVTLDIRHGEILALLGENGSGKTTLMNILSGIYLPDEGHVFINGEEVSIFSPKDAYKLGIGMVHQHFKLVDVFTATENIVLGINDKTKFDLKAAAVKIREICDQYGFDVNPDKHISDMSVSEMQEVEIVKVLYRGADILILDEPTAVLTPQEADRLFAVMRSMKANGKSIIIITHKLNEVMEISDRVAVLRKGQFAGEVLTKDTNPEELTNMMMGRKVELNIERPDPVDPKTRLVVENLSVIDEDGIQRLKNVSFSANSGEILGIAGITGCGQKELLESIAGLQTIEEGSIRYIEDDGTEEELIGKNPKEITDMGVLLSFVPEDRLGMGLVGTMDLTDNMLLRSFREGHSVFANRNKPKNLAKEVVKDLRVDTPGISTQVSKLSGGNIQKVLVGREISSAPKVLMTAYAVRGLDVNASYMIYELINRQKKMGSAVIFVGEDLDVLIEFCDKILVLCEGEVNGILDGRTASKRQIGLLMTHKEEV